MPEMNIAVVLSTQKILQLPGFSVLRGEWWLKMTFFFLSHVHIQDSLLCALKRAFFFFFLKHLAHFIRSRWWKPAATGTKFAVYLSNILTSLVDGSLWSLLCGCAPQHGCTWKPIVLAELAAVVSQEDVLQGSELVMVCMGSQSWSPPAGPVLSEGPESCSGISSSLSKSESGHSCWRRSSS